MLNEILYGITRRLDELFPDCRIYTDAVEQGLEEPCFFVNLLEPERKPLLGRRSYQENGFCVQYFSGDLEQKNEDLNRAADILMDGMEYITLGNGSRLRGAGRSFRVVDGVLNFFVSYNMTLTAKGAAGELMDEMKWKGAVLGDKEKGMRTGG